LGKSLYLVKEKNKDRWLFLNGTLRKIRRIKKSMEYRSKMPAKINHHLENTLKQKDDEQ